MIDHFWRLRLPWTATDDEIRAAYHRLALDVHPDRAPAGASARERARRTRAMARLNESFAVLEDPGQRARHRSALERQRAARTKAIPVRPPKPTPASAAAPGRSSGGRATTQPTGNAYRRPAQPEDAPPAGSTVWRSPFDDLGDRYERAKRKRGAFVWFAASLRIGAAVIGIALRACATSEPSTDRTPTDSTVDVTAPAAPPTSAAPTSG